MSDNVDKYYPSDDSNTNYDKNGNNVSDVNLLSSNSVENISSSIRTAEVHVTKDLNLATDHLHPTKDENELCQCTVNLSDHITSVGCNSQGSHNDQDKLISFNTHFLSKHEHIDTKDKFISILSSVPLVLPSHNISVTGFIHDKQVTFLTDTGANVSAIRAELWQQIPPLSTHPPLSPQITQIRAVNGQTIPVLSQVHVPFTIEGHTYPFDVLVTETSAYDVILGKDFLEHYHANVDLQHRVLDLHCDEFPLGPIEHATPV